MGVLANLAAQLFPDFNADGSPYSPSQAALRQIFGAADNAIPNAQDLGAETAARLAGEKVLLTGVQQETTARIAADAAIQDQIDGTLTASEAAQTAAAAAQQMASVFPAALAAQAASLYLAPRPGDTPAAFTTDLAAGISGVPPNAASVTTGRGTALRVAGALPALATCGLRALEPNRLYKVRAAFARVVDTAAPTPAAVVFAVAWYGSDKNRLAVPSTQVAVVGITVASGLAAYTALFGLNPPDQSNLDNPRVAPPPAGAVYFRPYLQIFGDDVVTDLLVIEHADVTDASIALSPPLDMVLARLARLEAAANLPAL